MNLLAKDNDSEIKLLKNGRDSCAWNSRHIGIKYFWVTDRIKNGNIEVIYCPTDEMIADYMSKPLQGSLFKTFRSALMGWTHVGEVFKAYKLHTRPKERVENNENIKDESETNDNETRNNANGPNMQKYDDIGSRNRAVKLGTEAAVIEQRRITDNEEIRRRKNKSYADAVKQHNRTMLNEMNKHLIN